MSRRHVGAWAIVRFQAESTELQAMITVKEVVPSKEEAEQEVHRLQRLPDKPEGVTYFSQYTRYYPEGRSAT